MLGQKMLPIGWYHYKSQVTALLVHLIRRRSTRDVFLFNTSHTLTSLTTRPLAFPVACCLFVSPPLRVYTSSVALSAPHRRTPYRAEIMHFCTIQACMNACMCTCGCYVTYVCMRVSCFMHACMYICIHVRVYFSMCMHTFMHMCVCACE